jgi:phosphoglycolate phosphatase
MRAKPGSSMKPFGKNSHMLALFEWRPYRESMRKSYAVQAIIFDLDGTLVDSAEDLRAALNVVLNATGLRSIEADEVRSMIGDGVAKLVERALVAVGGDLKQKSTLAGRFLEIYQANPLRLTRCYPGVTETLDRLGTHFRLAVATNKPVVATNRILRGLSLDRLFSVVVGGDTLPRRKPDPAPLLEVLRQFAIGADQALLVGDNMHDVEAAHAAGMRCVAVSYGYHHTPPAELQADHVIDRFDDLLSLVIDPCPDSAIELRSKLDTSRPTTGV